MKRLKYILSSLVCVVVLLCVATVNASADVVDSGSCGENASYTFDSDGILTISGMGSMSNYLHYYPSDLPWASFVDEIKVIVISDGITNIGDYAFSNCDKLRSVYIPSSVTSIGKDAFYFCNDIQNVYISSLDKWFEIIFATCYSNPLYYKADLILNHEKVTDLTIPSGGKRNKHTVKRMYVFS